MQRNGRRVLFSYPERETSMPYRLPVVRDKEVEL